MNNTNPKTLDDHSGFIRVSEFANLYFPSYTRPEGSTRMFRQRIRASKDLYEKLLATGYNEKDRLINPAQIEIITVVWGSPEAYKRKYSRID